MTKAQENRINSHIADRKAFREWWDDITRRMPYYASPEHELIAWAAWEAGRAKSAISTPKRKQNAVAGQKDAKACHA